MHPVTDSETAATALVLAGGGVAGIAWELGVLRGLADADPALADRVLAADLVVGTSAGSAVAAQVPAVCTSTSSTRRSCEPGDS